MSDLLIILDCCDGGAACETIKYSNIVGGRTYLITSTSSNGIARLGSKSFANKLAERLEELSTTGGFTVTELYSQMKAKFRATQFTSSEWEFLQDKHDAYPSGYYSIKPRYNQAYFSTSRTYGGESLCAVFPSRSATSGFQKTTPPPGQNLPPNHAHTTPLVAYAVANEERKEDKAKDLDMVQVISHLAIDPGRYNPHSEDQVSARDRDSMGDESHTVPLLSVSNNGTESNFEDTTAGISAENKKRKHRKSVSRHRDNSRPAKKPKIEVSSKLKKHRVG